MNNDWIKNPNLSGIDPAKLAMLQSMASQGNGKNQNDMVSFLMAASANAKKNGTQFTPQEMSMIIDVLKKGKSKEEVSKIDQMMHIMRMMK